MTGVLFGLIRGIFCHTSRNGFWFTGTGTILTVLSLLLCVGYNHTAYYPSTADLQSSLTLANSSSSLFTLKTMAYVSLLLPVVVAYIAYVWKVMDRKPLTSEEITGNEDVY